MVNTTSPAKNETVFVGVSICEAYMHTFITAIFVYFSFNKKTPFFPLITGTLTGMASNILSRKIELPNSISLDSLKVSQLNSDKIILDFGLFLF